jgi:endonuclease YncB( thermonuclease family)
VDRGTRFFWALVVALLGASLYFGVNAEAQRRSVQKSEATVATGDVVSFVRAVDGDTLLVANQAGESVAVRLLGIKAFAAGTDKDPTSRFGQAAVDELTSLVEDKPLRVLLNDPPTDKHGRTLAELFVADQDVGLQLVRRGLVLVYTVYPFPSMALYLQEQEAARAKRLGIWGDAEVAKRADLQLEQWRREAR